MFAANLFASVTNEARSAEEAVDFIDAVALPDDVRADICFNNAERYPGLDTTRKAS
jgi:predicted TIM-barrel fold metal-dependent hydrolase